MVPAGAGVAWGWRVSHTFNTTPTSPLMTGNGAGRDAGDRCVREAEGRGGRVDNGRAMNGYSNGGEGANAMAL